MEGQVTLSNIPFDHEAKPHPSSESSLPSLFCSQDNILFSPHSFENGVQNIASYPDEGVDENTTEEDGILNREFAGSSGAKESSGKNVLAEEVTTTDQAQDPANDGSERKDNNLESDKAQQLVSHKNLEGDKEIDGRKDNKEEEEEEKVEEMQSSCKKEKPVYDRKYFLNFQEMVSLEMKRTKEEVSRVLETGRQRVEWVFINAGDHMEQISVLVASDAIEQEETMQVPTDLYDLHKFPIAQKSSREAKNFLSQYKATLKKNTSQWDEFIMKAIMNSPKPERDALCRAGIPSSRRADVWMAVSGARRMQMRSTESYESILQQGIREECSHQIEADLLRTFPDHPGMTKDEIEKLRRLLKAVCVVSKKGYFQGMNFICGGLLLFATEEESFWLMRVLLEDIVPQFWGSLEMEGLIVDRTAFEILFQEKLPQLHKHFQTHEAGITEFFPRWMLGLFVNVLPSETAFRVWDCLFNEGFTILFSVALGILKLHQTRLLLLEDYESLMLKLSSLGSDLYDCDLVIKTSLELFGNIQSSQIEDCRVQHRPSIQEELAHRQVRKEEFDLQRRSNFDNSCIRSLRIWLEAQPMSSTDLDLKSYLAVVRDCFPQCTESSSLEVLRKLAAPLDFQPNYNLSLEDLIFGLKLISEETQEAKLEASLRFFDIKAGLPVDRSQVREFLLSVVRFGESLEDSHVNEVLCYFTSSEDSFDFDSFYEKASNYDKLMSIYSQLQ